jgi:hypothetical protein
VALGDIEDESVPKGEALEKEVAETDVLREAAEVED